MSFVFVLLFPPLFSIIDTNIYKNAKTILQDRFLVFFRQRTFMESFYEKCKKGGKGWEMCDEEIMSIKQDYNAT